MEFDLRFSSNELSFWADRYSYATPEENARHVATGSKFEEKGYLTLNQLARLCEWKTPRSQPDVQKNSELFVREVTRSCVTSDSERVRIEVLTLLDGVAWSTASVILHFGHPDPYPIIDYWALWSLGVDEPSRYTFGLWSQYVQTCRVLSEKSGLSMREVDQALWQYSKKKQDR
ncbi:hypothetical protein [Salinibacter ruber]|uniref:hypothetical protein n=1 Tax=Salinibacter ruber TaxID=146919 RepID=UPI0020742254|nr:hypothetical protein [Salinibacter ruber]